jgi:hypothetical protein
LAVDQLFEFGAAFERDASLVGLRAEEFDSRARQIVGARRGGGRRLAAREAQELRDSAAQSIRLTDDEFQIAVEVSREPFVLAHHLRD